MTQIQAALKEAGVALPPVNKRIWLWLKDHPNKSANEIGTALRLKKNSISSILCQLAGRGLFTDKQEFRKNLGRAVKVYSVVNPNEFILGRKTKPVKEIVMEPVKVAAPVPATPVNKYEKDIDAMTVAEARELYKLLHKMFGKEGK